jgi:large subunit ribosomal protein L17
MHTAKLGRKKEHRERTLRNLMTSLFLYESITTTQAKARALRSSAERLMTRTADGSLTARRYAKQVLFDMNAVAKLFEDINPRRQDRTSGFVRLTKFGVRPGDGAPMARLELILKPLEQVIAEESSTKVKVRRSKKEENVTEETPDTEKENV